MRGLLFLSKRGGIREDLVFLVAPHFIGFPFFALNILFPPESFDVFFTQDINRNTRPHRYGSPVFLRHPSELLIYAPRLSIYLVIKLYSWQRLFDLIPQLYRVDFRGRSRRVWGLGCIA